MLSWQHWPHFLLVLQPWAWERRSINKTLLLLLLLLLSLKHLLGSYFIFYKAIRQYNSISYLKLTMKSDNNCVIYVVSHALIVLRKHIFQGRPANAHVQSQACLITLTVSADALSSRTHLITNFNAIKMSSGHLHA